MYINGKFPQKKQSRERNLLWHVLTSALACPTSGFRSLDLLQVQFQDFGKKQFHKTARHDLLWKPSTFFLHFPATHRTSADILESKNRRHVRKQTIISTTSQDYLF
jgi:hypothetical protein